MNKILLVYEDYTDLMTTESALKKVGYDVIGITNEYTLSEQVVAFNPEVVVAQGSAGKVTALGVGKRLKEMPRWAGKVVLIFAPNNKPGAQDIMKMRVDLMLKSPVIPTRMIQVLSKLLQQDESQLLEKFNKIANVNPNASNAANIVSGKSEESDSIYVGGKVDDGSSSFLSRVKKSKDLYSDESEVSGDTSEQPFGAVDISELEAELTGKPKTSSASPAQPSASLPQDSAEEISPEVIESLRREIQEAEFESRERIKKYSKLTENIRLSPESTVTRVEARRRQKEIAKDWDKKELEDQDRLRREFTTALFKK